MITEAEKAYFRELGARQQPTEEQRRKIAEIVTADEVARSGVIRAQAK